MNFYVPVPIPILAFRYTHQLHDELEGYFKKYGKGKKDGPFQLKIRSENIGKVLMYDNFVSIATGIYFRPKEGLSISNDDHSEKIPVEIGAWVAFNDEHRKVFSHEYFNHNYVNTSQKPTNLHVNHQ